MSSLSSLLEDVTSMIHEIASLSEEQRTRFLAVADKLDEKQLSALKTTLLKVREEEMAQMKADLETLHKAGAAFKEWQADKARVALQTSESSSLKADAVSADGLLSKL